MVLVTAEGSYNSYSWWQLQSPTVTIYSHQNDSDLLYFKNNSHITNHDIVKYITQKFQFKNTRI